MKILTVLGARPQFIKAGSVSREIAKYPQIKEVIIHTGQHYDSNMSEIFFKEMHIPKPDYFLNINGLSHGAMTGQMMEKIEEVVLEEKPDIILVYGDTNSTLSGALVGAKLHTPVAHIEAGLRSFNMQMPEEVNRILTDRVSSWLFCPTETAVENLKKEAFPFPIYSPITNYSQQILNVGDVMYDGALFYKQFAKKPKAVSNLEFLVSNKLDTKNQQPKTKNYILATIHRAENTDNPQRLRAIFEALQEISKEMPIILPLHPRTKQKLKSANINTTYSQINIIDPVGYLEMVWLLENCSLVMTDSGGLQKEAYFFNKACITLRDETEWIELVEHGYNILAGANREKIIRAFNQMQNFKIPNNKSNLYGNGDSSKKIVKALLNE